MISSGNQTVADFFQSANWQGLKLVDDDVSLLNSKPVNELHLGLTVEEYFTLNNWQGIPVNSAEDSISEVSGGSVYSLKMSVEEFFQRIVWQGQKQRNATVKQIGTQPHLSQEKQIHSQPRSTFNLQDLSDLM